GCWICGGQIRPYGARNDGEVGVRSRVRCQIECHPHAGPEIGAEGNPQSILAKRNPGGVEVLLRGHFNNFSLDQFDALLEEETQVEQSVELLARPTPCFRMVEPNGGHVLLPLPTDSLPSWHGNLAH